jgi:hypothetical protein
MEGRLKLAVDEEGHWYCIPADQDAEFHELLENGYRTDEWHEFDELFGHCRLNKHWSSYTFTDWRPDFRPEKGG